MTTEAFLHSLSAEISMEKAKFNGMKAIVITPTAHKTNMLNLTSLINSINQLWHVTDQSVKDEYGSYLYEGVVLFLRAWNFFSFTEFIFISHDVASVSRCISSTLTTVSPRKRYRTSNLLTSVSFDLHTRLPSELTDIPLKILVYLIMCSFYVIQRISETLNIGSRKTDKIQ